MCRESALSISVIGDEGCYSKLITQTNITVKNIENDDEMSVYATAGHSGALIISVEPGSEAERIGLRENDVIIAWGSAEICTVSDLKNCAFDGSGVTILRKQQKVILK